MLFTCRFRSSAMREICIFFLPIFGFGFLSSLGRFSKLVLSEIFSLIVIFLAVKYILTIFVRRVVYKSSIGGWQWKIHWKLGKCSRGRSRGRREPLRARVWVSERFWWRQRADAHSHMTRKVFMHRNIMHKAVRPFDIPNNPRPKNHNNHRHTFKWAYTIYNLKLTI